MSDLEEALRWLAEAGGLVRFGCEDKQLFVRASLRLHGDSDRLIVAKVGYGPDEDPLSAVVEAVRQVQDEVQAQEARGRLRAV